MCIPDARQQVTVVDVELVDAAHGRPAGVVRRCNCSSVGGVTVDTTFLFLATLLAVGLYSQYALASCL